METFLVLNWDDLQQAEFDLLVDMYDYEKPDMKNIESDLKFEIMRHQINIEKYELEIAQSPPPNPSRIRQLEEWIRGAKKSIRRLEK